MTIRKPVLGTGYSGTALIVTGALHVQLHMDDVIGFIVDDVIILLYRMYGILSTQEQ